MCTFQLSRKKRNVRLGHTSHAMLDPPSFVARRIIYPQACNFARDSAPCVEQFCISSSSVYGVLLAVILRMKITYASRKVLLDTYRECDWLKYEAQLFFCILNSWIDFQISTPLFRHSMFTLRLLQFIWNRLCRDISSWKRKWFVSSSPTPSRIELIIEGFHSDRFFLTNS